MRHTFPYLNAGAVTVFKIAFNNYIKITSYLRLLRNNSYPSCHHLPSYSRTCVKVCCQVLYIMALKTDIQRFFNPQANVWYFGYFSRSQQILNYGLHTHYIPGYIGKALGHSHYSEKEVQNRLFNF